MKRFLLCGALCALSVLPAHAQGRVNAQNQPNGAVFPLPPNVQNVVSIDAQNLLIYQSQTNGQTVYTPSIVQHVYSGGIARLFGGTVIPTAQFATPGLFNQANRNGQTGVNNGGGFTGGNNNGGNNGGGFGGNGGFTNGVFDGPVFNRGAINARVRPR